MTETAPSANNPAKALLIGLGAGVLMLIVLVLALLFWDDVLPDAKAQSQHDAQDEAATVVEAKAALQMRVAGAESITFGKVKVNWLGEQAAVCGQADIEEPDDALEGPERFVFVDSQLLLESRDGSAAVAAKRRDVCDAA